jgi:4-hydroxybenzoate polyprenyltransferase
MTCFTPGMLPHLKRLYPRLPILFLTGRRQVLVHSIGKLLPSGTVATGAPTHMRATVLLEMIKFSHTVFALPFALVGALLAANYPTPGEGWSVFPAPATLGWILVAMVGARTAAMGLNRLIDHRIDAANPRTRGRALPAGLVSRAQVLTLIGLALALLFLAAWRLGPLCLALAPLAVALFVLYAYAKRFSSLSHVVLGVCLAFAPLGAWIAVRGTADWAVVPLCLAVVCWLAGFDTLYALQDLEFDRAYGLRSIPARLGVARALRVARAFHAAMVLLLASLPAVFPLGAWYVAGLLGVTGLLAYEHSLLAPDDLSKLDVAFFNVNGTISVTLFAATLVDLLL